MTPDSSRSPEDEGRTSARAGRRLWERVAHPARQSTQRTCDWFRTAFVDQHGQYRVPPRMRSVQVGTAAVAVGVLGVLATPSGHEPQAEPQQAAVHQAAEVAPLSAPDPHGASLHADSSAGGNGGNRDSAQQRSGDQQRGGDQQRDGDRKQQGDGDRKQQGERDRSDRQQSDDKQDGEKGDRKQDDKQGGEKGGERQQSSADQSKDQIDRWIDQATAVLERNGVPREQLDHEAIRTIIEKESGGDPNAVNNWDSNASAGTPSKGLMQTIEPTFEEHSVPGHGNILDPVDNIAAATKYSIERYGSVSEVPGVEGVRSGSSYQGY